MKSSDSLFLFTVSFAVLPVFSLVFLVPIEGNARSQESTGEYRETDHCNYETPDQTGDEVTHQSPGPGNVAEGQLSGSRMMNRQAGDLRAAMRKRQQEEIAVQQIDEVRSVLNGGIPSSLVAIWEPNTGWSYWPRTSSSAGETRIPPGWSDWYGDRAGETRIPPGWSDWYGDRAGETRMPPVWFNWNGYRIGGTRFNWNGYRMYPMGWSDWYGARPELVGPVGGCKMYPMGWSDWFWGPSR